MHDCDHDWAEVMDRRRPTHRVWMCLKCSAEKSERVSIVTEPTPDIIAEDGDPEDVIPIQKLP